MFSPMVRCQTFLCVDIHIGEVESCCDGIAAYEWASSSEDGNYQEFEIEASSETEAHAKADSIAQSSMVDVTYIEVYKVA